MQNRREFLELMTGTIAAAAMGGTAPTAVEGQASTQALSRPKNLLIITADDLNCDSVGWMGSNMGATPHIDSFAKTAYANANAHSAAPICQPSREALMTGRVPHRSGALGFDPVDADCATLWECMKAAGYYTVGLHKLTHMAPEAKFNWDWRSEGRKNNQDTGRDPARYLDEVTEAIRRARDAGQPFFINANINDPHRPFYGTAEDRARGGVSINNEYKTDEVTVPGFLDDVADVRREVTQYFNSVRRLDESFGQVLRALDSSGAVEDTVVVFLSDHGMAFPFAKTTLYKCGTWTPLMIRAPGVSRSLVDREHVVGNIDVMPTVLELVGVEQPGGMDGRSIAALLSGGAQTNRNHVFTHITSQASRLFFPSRCVRTKESAYIFNSWSDGNTRFKNESMTGLTFDAMRSAAADNASIAQRVDQFLYRQPEEFYDLRRDPHERENQISNPEHREEIARLKELMSAQMKATADPLTEEFAAS